MKAAAVALLFAGCGAQIVQLPDGRIQSPGLPAMLYCVDRTASGCELYRSAQPTADEFVALHDRLGLKSIVKLNSALEGRDRLPAGVEPFEHPWPFVGPVDHDDALAALYDLEHAPRPALIHCTHGVDRTGLLVALWRVVHEHVPAASAWAEWRAFPRSKVDALLYDAFERETGFHVPEDER